MRYERKRFSFLEKGVVGNSKFEQRRKRELLPLGGPGPLEWRGSVTNS